MTKKTCLHFIIGSGSRLRILLPFMAALLLTTGWLGCRKQQSVSEPLIEYGAVTDALVRQTMDQLNGSRRALAFYTAAVSSFGVARWDVARAGTANQVTVCLLPITDRHSTQVTAVLAIETGPVIKIRVLDAERYPAHVQEVASTPEGRLVHLFNFLISGVQGLSQHGLNFAPLPAKNLTGQGNGTARAVAITVSICYSWTSCTGDGRGNCVGNYRYHTDCISETYWESSYDFIDGGGYFPGDGGYEGGGGGPAGAPYPSIIHAPVTPIGDIRRYLACFSQSQGGRLILYADQPLAYSDEPFTLLGKMGHVFLAVEQVVNGQRIVRHVGFHPASKVNPFNSTRSPSSLGNDEGKIFDVSLTVELPADRFQHALDAIINANPTYDLEAYNCTDFVLDVAKAAGVNLPRTSGWWIFGRGHNPGNFGQDLRKQPGANGSSGSADVNTGNCP